MKKFFAFVVAMAMTVAANADLISFKIADDAKSFDVVADALVVGATFTISGADIDFASAVVEDYATARGVQFPNGVYEGGPLKYLVAPAYDAGRPGWYSFATGLPENEGDVPADAYTLMSGFALADMTDLSFSKDANGAIAEIVLSLANGSYSNADVTLSSAVSPYTTSIYLVPEPMTMALLGLGGLVAARRRNA